MGGIRIGVNALYLIPGGVGGTEIYLRSLLAALSRLDPANEYTIFTNRETGPDVTPEAANFHCAPQPVRASNRPARILWEQTRLPLAVARRELDVLLNPGFTAPLLCPAPAVTVFHDMQHKRHPEHFRWFDLPAWRLCLFQAACSSDALIAVSESTRADLLRYYPIAPGKVRVIPHGVDEWMFKIGQRRQPSLEQPYLLCVSTLHPHKNIDRLVRAFAEFRRRRPRYRLVLAGMRGFHASAVESLVDGLGLRGAVEITGWIPREQLYELYRGAHACAYPSTFEGFGLPVLEALAAGIPAACSAIDPLKDLAGDAAVLFDPLDEAALLDAMARVSDDEELRRCLSLRGPAQAARYSWRRAAEATLDLLESVAP
ncbi:MAG: glycosyltransferase family 4 protein [Bryobacteraceae bacterium]|nr:glycosyltransferase family 4 protein [Bryobacteraceae bacterium]